MLTGEAANRRAAHRARPGRPRVQAPARRPDADPRSAARRIAPSSSLARLLRSVVDAVAELRGRPARRAIVRDPPRQLGAVQDRPARPGRPPRRPRATPSSSPSPRRRRSPTRRSERVEPGEVVAVYDLGGGTFDAAVLRKTEAGFEILGQPEGIERLGGIDFDEAVFQPRARTRSTARSTDLDPDDPRAIAAVARLRAGVRRGQGGALDRHRRRRSRCCSPTCRPRCGSPGPSSRP